MKPIEEVFNTITAMGCEIEPCGSRVTCNPAPKDTDQDFLVVVPSKMQVVSNLVSYLVEAGFNWEGSKHYQIVAASDFMSWRRGDVNLIVTANSTFAMRHRVATYFCKRLNLLDKEDRIAAFQAILYGQIYNPKETEDGHQEKGSEAEGAKDRFIKGCDEKAECQAVAQDVGENQRQEREGCAKGEDSRDSFTF